ncbi:hypothetical protein [Paraburkholderia tuberum]|uniref:Uncharacterized protein n=1 Tax=Paraburkholderia tuberum TaxID=157910 RepID=A0A1H1KMM2_9BURK|nr:hypothetical protein [Paraburkholderia tuberum]SDR63015.1 hypothetical protein SAMN05445850_8568 [Paraburkholderia tuberum]
MNDIEVVSIRSDFPSGFTAELGWLFIAFGRLEYLLKLCFKDLEDSRFHAGMGEAEYQGAQFKTLCKVVRAKAGEKLGAAAGSFCSLVDEASLLSAERDHCVHACWTVEASGQAVRIRPKRKKSGRGPIDWSESRVVTVGELNGIRRQAERIFVELDRVRKAWRADA